MTTIDPNVVDTLLAQGLRERAADLGDEDGFYQQVLATVAVVPQRRWFRRWPAWFGRRTTLVFVAAALVGAVAGGALLAGSGVVKLPSVPPSIMPTYPTPTASATPSASPSPDGVAIASPSPHLSMPSSSPEPCLTDTVEVLSGDALPPVEADTLDGLGQSRGVYLARRQPILWAVNPGQDSATLIASIIAPGALPLEVLDISPDGSIALIRVGNFSPPGFTPECADLYMVRTDGSGATRLTRFGTGRFVTGGAFSPDGRRVAYTWWDPNTITTLDLETGASVDQSCTTLKGFGPTRIDWSPTGDQVAVGCERTLTIFDAGGTTPPAKFPMDEEPLAFRWSDDRQLVVASGGGNIYSFDVPSETSTVVGRFEDPAIVITSATGVFSPDGRWLAYHGGERGDRPGNAFREVGYLVATSGGTPTRIPGELQDTTWSADSRALVSVTGGEGGWNLVRMDVETLQSSTIGTIINRQPFPLGYRQGIWRVP